MEAREAKDKKKRSQEHPLPHCGDFKKMAEMMKTCCASEDGPIDCSTMMRTMMSKRRKPEKTR